IPGVELSTPQGHVLAYLPNLEALTKFYARLDVVERGTPRARYTNAIVECLNLLQSLGGFGILAHVDVPSGFETENPGASPHKFDVLCHAALLGIELKSAVSPISYADGDPDTGRVQAGKPRLLVTKKVLRGGKEQHVTREFSRLSLGQQQSILLT